MKKLTTKEFIERSKEVHNIKYDYSKVNYKNIDTNVEIICPIHGSFFQRPDHHLNGMNCKKCSTKSNKNIQRLTKISNEFISKAKKIHGDTYDYSKVEYINAKIKVCIICPTHGKFWVTPDSHLHGSKCYKCSIIINANNQRDDNKSFITKAKKIHGDTYDYSNVKYLGNRIPVEIICLVHGSFFQLPYNHLAKKGCPKCPNCTNSKSEKIIEKYLISKNIKFNRQFKFNNCKNKYSLPFDFYLPDYNCCIEYDGRQHFNEIKIWGGKIALDKQKINDDIKTNYCINNNIKLLRINYKENIENKLNEFL